MSSSVLRTSLRARLVLIFALLAIIPVATVGVISYNRSYRAIRERTTQSALMIAEQLTANVDFVFRDAARFLKIGTHETTMQFLNPVGQTEERTYRLALEIIQLFQLFREIYEFDDRIRGIHIIGFNGNNIGEDEGRYTLPVEPMQIATVRRSVENRGNVLLIPNREIDYAGIRSYRDVISIATAIVRPVTRELLGVIIVDVDRSAITTLTESVRIGQTGSFSIVSSEGVAIYPDVDDVASSVSSEAFAHIATTERGWLTERSHTPAELIVFTTLERWGWKVVGRVSVPEIMESAFRIRTVTWIAVVCSIVFATLLYLVVSDTITHPIRDLMEAMKAAERGDLSIRASCSSRDEISDLCRGFNRMLGEIRSLMDHQAREHEDLKKSELKALQAQINPHFLYNTLDAILWMAEAKSTDRVIRITRALSGFFRISLAGGKEWISAQDEIKHIRHYLDIQKMRHRDLLEYEIEERGDIDGIRTLKFTLQPIVENAVDHGIKNRRGGGTVSVVCSRGDHDLSFVVKDNGVGIPADKLRALRHRLRNGATEPDGPNGYGLHNVNQRIRLYYGPEWGIDIQSQPGEGTTVTVRVPAQSEG